MYRVSLADGTDMGVVDVPIEKSFESAVVDLGIRTTEENLKAFMVHGGYDVHLGSQLLAKFRFHESVVLPKTFKVKRKGHHYPEYTIRKGVSTGFLDGDVLQIDSMAGIRALAKQIAQGYDHYTAFIEDHKQMKQAELLNKERERKIMTLMCLYNYLKTGSYVADQIAWNMINKAKGEE